MKILVTGGAGFIGSHLAGGLLDKGHEVVIVDNLSSGHEENIPAKAHFHKTELCSEEFDRLIGTFRPRIIFHLAAQMDVRKSMNDPLFDAQTNVLGTVRLLKAACEAGTAKVIFSSTGGAIYGEQDFFPANEDHPCRPVSAYGTSKHCGENYLGFFERTGGPRAIILRYANVYGPRQDPHGEAGVVAIFIQRMLQNKSITIYGDGSQTRDFIYVDDVVNANLIAIEKDTGGVFNIGTGRETDINTLASSLAKIIGSKKEFKYGPERSGEQRRSVVDPTKAWKILGWTPRISIEDGLRKTVSFFENTSRIQ